MRVVVVTRTDLGWDCIVGVYESEEAAVRNLEYESLEAASSAGFVFFYQPVYK